jgi:hypothetical protein
MLLQYAAIEKVSAKNAHITDTLPNHSCAHVIILIRLSPVRHTLFRMFCNSFKSAQFHLSYALFMREGPDIKLKKKLH